MFRKRGPLQKWEAVQDIAPSVRGLFVLKGETMASKKNRSSWAKEKAQFNAQLGGFDALDDVFAREDSRHAHLAEERDSAQRYKACESKNRYATLAEAQENLAWCQKQGKRGLQIYECPYCGGWHLTSHPWEDAR